MKISGFFIFFFIKKKKGCHHSSGLQSIKLNNVFKPASPGDFTYIRERGFFPPFFPGYRFNLTGVGRVCWCRQQGRYEIVCLVRQLSAAALLRGQ